MRLRGTIARFFPQLLFLALMIGCQVIKPAGPPNVILISIDGLRADFLTPERMPLLYEFARRRCRIFENARANSTWSTPSNVTMLTGLLQSEHGVEYNDSVIQIEIELIQEKLQKSGYTTAAFVSGGNLGTEFGFDRGFMTFLNVAESPSEPGSHDETFRERQGKRMASLNEAEHFMDSHPPQPIFLYIQTNAVSDYWLDAYSQNKRISDEIERLKGEEKVLEPERLLWDNFEEKTSVKRKRDIYSAAVRRLDRRLHDYLTFLQQSAIFPNAKVIITSGHGEGLGDVHGEYISYGHAASPYSDQINVPLIVYGLGKGRTDRLVGLDEIAGTILSFAGVQKEPPKSLFRRRKRIVSEYISRDRSGASRAAAYMTADRKFLVSLDDKLHVFMDPLDADDLIHLYHPEMEDENISEELKEQLSALGYMQP